MNEKRSYVYILASSKHGTLYIGVTANLTKRMYEHKNDIHEGFTQKHGVHKLVYFETYDDIRDAIHRETCLKRWKRDWKIRLIEEQNPDWHDLYEGILA